MTPKPLAAVVAACLLPAGCGGSQTGDQARTQTATPRTDTVPVPPPGTQRDPRELPPGVPLRASGAVDPAGERVVRAWSAAMRASDIDAAGALWAPPAKVQNGTPVLTLATRAEVGIFNGSLPCGSVVTSAGGAAGFVIATFRLTEREGAQCDGAGNSARAAILVRGGRIVEWYRLPDDPDAPGLQPPPLDDVESTAV